MGPSYYRTGALIRKGKLARDLSFNVCREEAMGGQREGGHLHGRKRSLTRHQP